MVAPFRIHITLHFLLRGNSQENFTNTAFQLKVHCRKPISISDSNKDIRRTGYAIPLALNSTLIVFPRWLLLQAIHHGAPCSDSFSYHVSSSAISARPESSNKRAQLSSGAVFKHLKSFQTELSLSGSRAQTESGLFAAGGLLVPVVALKQFIEGSL